MSILGRCSLVVWMAAATSQCVCLWQESKFEHACTYSTGGLPTLRHNSILTADFVAEVCSNVCTETELQLLSGEELQERNDNYQDSV